MMKFYAKVLKYIFTNVSLILPVVKRTFVQKNIVNSSKSSNFFYSSVLALLFLMVGTGSVSAVTYTATQSGNWNASSTWGGSGYPQAGDDAVVNQNYTITLTDNASCRNLTFGGNPGVIALGLYDLSLGGDLTLTCTAGTFTTSTGYIVLNGTSQTINLCTGGGNSIPNLRLSNSTAVSMGPQTNLTITGNFDCQTGSSTFTNNTTSWNTGALVITGTCTAPNCTFTVAQNNVTNAIDFSSSTSNPIQVGGVIDNQSNSKITFGSKNVYTTTAFTGTYTSNIIHTGVVTVLSSLKQFKSNAVNGSWNVKGSWLQSTDGGVSWAVATSTPTSSDIVTIQSGHTIQLIAAAASNNLTINGTLDLGTFVLTGSGVLTLSSSGTLLIGGASNYPTGFTTSTLNDGSTVNYYLGGAQTISNQLYYNLILSGSGAKTLPVGVTTISGNFTLSGASTTTTVANLTIGGNLTIGDGTTFNAAGYNMTVMGTTTVGGGTSGTLNFTSNVGTKIFAGLVTNNVNASWNNSANENITFRGGLTSYGGGNAGTGVYTFDTNNQTLTGTMVIPNVTVNVITLTNNSVLTVATNLSGTGSLTQGANATLYIGGSSGITTLNATNTGNTVYYNATADQTVTTTNYYNLSFTGSGRKTVTASFNVSGNLSIASPDVAALTSAINVLTNSLTLGVSNQLDGTYGSTGSGATYTNNTYFYNSFGYRGIVTVSSACAYGSNSLPTGLAVFTPVIDSPSHVQQVSTTFKSGQYFVLNVIKGLVYQVYTNSSPGSALKMAVYEEGNTTGPLLASSLSSTGSGGNANDVYLSFTSPLSGQVRVLINRKSDCSATNITGLTVNVNVSGGNNTQDSRTAAGTNTWIGQVYDSNFNYHTFDNYLGYYNIGSETINENFGTGASWPSDDATSFSIYSNGTIRANVLDYTFNVSYFMNSTRKGFYSAVIVSDDGAELTVDGNIVYNHWDPHSPTTNNNVLLSLTGSSLLKLDYFEQGGQNGISFNITPILINNLSVNNSQVLCKNTTGSSISGDDFPTTLPTGMSGNSYQWYYSTPTDPTRRIITGATSATYTPISSSAPFNNVVGVYYLYRVAKLSTTNNYDPNPYNATNESNAATVRVRSCPNYWIGDVSSTNWNTASNWSDGSVPLSGDYIEFATDANNGVGNAAKNDLILDNNYTVGSFTNQSGKQLIIAPATSLTVTGAVTTTNSNQILIQSAPSQANGSFIFPQSTTAYATVQMYSKAKKAASLPPTAPDGYVPVDFYSWQYFGVPITPYVVADPTFAGSYLEKQNEIGDYDHKWSELGNSDQLKPFQGYAITQDNPTTIFFSGKLVNTDQTYTLPYSGLPNTDFPGQSLLANPYTAAIDINQLVFNSAQQTVYLYNTGSYGEWYNNATSTGNSNGQYLAIPKNATPVGSLPNDIPSMSGFMVNANAGGGSININYSSVIKNVNPQRAPAANKASSSDKTYIEIALNGEHTSDRMWLIDQPGTTHGFDNGWDGLKYSGALGTPMLFAMEETGNYQVSTSDNLNNTYLGFQAGVDVEDTLTFTHANIALKYDGLYLVDLVENKVVDISTSGTQYAFKAESTASPVKRFKIVTEPYVKDAADLNTQLKVFNDNATVFVDNQSNEKGELYFYDMMGRYLKKEIFGPNSISSFSVITKSGAYVVKAVTASEKVSKRIIVNYQSE